MSVQGNTTPFPSESRDGNFTEPSRMPTHPLLPGLFGPQQYQRPYIRHPLVNPGMPNAYTSPYAGQRLGSNTAGIPLASPPNPKYNNLARHMPNHFTPPLAYPIPTQWQALVPNGFIPSFAGCQPYMVNGVPTYLPSPPISQEQAVNAAGPSMPQPILDAPRPQPQATLLPSQPVTNALPDTPCPMASSKKRKRPDTRSDETSEESLEPEDDKERKRRYKNAMAARAATRKKIQQSELNKRRMTICISEIAIVKSHASIMIALFMAKGCDVIPPSPPPV